MISKSQISFIKSLHTKKHREEHGLFIVEGEKMLKELIESNFQIHSFFALENFYKNYVKIQCRTDKKQLYFISEAELHKISALSTPNEAVALVYLPNKQSSNQSIKIADNEWSIMLDTVQDPGNLGTIIRIADWFGIKNIYTSAEAADAYNPKVVQSTMGSIFRVNVVRTSLPVLIKENKDIPVYGALLDGENLFEANIQQPGIILMGNESKGISTEMRPLVTRELKIPNYGQAESLNVGIATGIFCAEMRRRNL